MIRSYKTELHPNNKQSTLFLKHAGVARFVYNWGLYYRIEHYKKTGETLNAQALHKLLVQLKTIEYPWMYEVSKCAAQNALRNLDTAFVNFFRNLKDKKCKKKGFPQFKSKKGSKTSYTVEGCISVDGKAIKLPKIGWIRLKEENYLPVGSEIKSASISQRADRWFVSINVEEEEKTLIETNITNEIIGIDLGIKTLATCSNGTIFENPKCLRKRSKKLRRLSKSHSRKQKGSKNREKSRKILARLHYKIANIRKDVLHKTTTTVAKAKPQYVVVEDLNVSGMMKNHRLAKSISECGFFEFRRMLAYKLERIGSYLILANRWFPSSKMCSCCFNIKDGLTLSDRIYHCDECGYSEERDFHGSSNLKYYPQFKKMYDEMCCKSWKDFSEKMNTVGSTGKTRIASLQACGDDVRLFHIDKAIVCEAGIKHKT